ncbi:MAG: helix-turn-helix domain-containing protein [Candidatus Omnitrophota bacterium]
MSENKPLKSAGALLKEARESKNISLEEAVKATHIHLSVLKSLESDDYSSISPVYAKGFFKLYAEFLGVSKEEVMERFQSAGQGQKKTSQKVIIPEASREASGAGGTDLLARLASAVRGIDRRVFIILVLIVLVFFGFRAIRSMFARRPARPAAAVAVKEKAPAPVKKDALAATKKNAVSGKAKSQASAKAGVAKEKVVLVVRAKTKTWLQVKVDGRTAFQNILNRGAAESWTANQKIEMMIGDAGGVELELNGRILEKIGRPGQALKQVVVTREGLTVEK